MFSPWGCITCSTEQHGGVGETQQDVVQEALHHGSVHMEAGGQVLGGDGRPTDEPRQALTHGQCPGQLPERQRAPRYALQNMSALIHLLIICYLLLLLRYLLEANILI